MLDVSVRAAANLLEVELLTHGEVGLNIDLFAFCKVSRLLLIDDVDLLHT